MAYELTRNFQDLYMAAVLDPGAQSSHNVATAFVFETSGDAMMVYFISPVTQVNGTLDLTFYIDTLTGLPDFNMEMRNGPVGTDDPDRPEAGGLTIGTPGSIVSPTVVDRWYKLSMTALSLTVGSAYFAILKNVSGIPASNHADIVFRGQLDGTPFKGNAPTVIGAGFTADGFLTDPTAGQGISPMILTFNDGTLMGQPYVESGAGASGTDWRGNRIQFDTDVVCSGIQFVGQGAAVESGTFSIYQGSTEIATVQANRTSGQNRIPVGRWVPVPLTAGLNYDFVFQPGSTSGVGTVYDTGQGTIPSEVTASKYHQATYVTGPTPGSFTEITEQIGAAAAYIDSYVSGAGAGGLLTHPGMQGGMRG